MGLRLSVLMLGVALGCAPAAPAQAPAPARVPAVSVLNLERQPTSLAALTRGRPALIALWATWCTACDKELDALNRLHARLNGRALVVGVAVGEPFGKVEDFVRSHRLAYPQFVDERFALADALGSERVPTTLVVDRDGTVRHAGGALDASALDALRVAMEK